MKGFAQRVFKQGQQFVFQSNKVLVNQSQLYNKFNNQKLALFGLTTLGLSFSTYYLMNNSVSLEEFYEITLKADFAEGEKRAIKVGPKDEDKILVVKTDGKYYAVSNSCPHFGFGLDKGLFFGDKVTCPLHMAQFSVKSGDHEYGPVFKGLETFDVVEKNGELHIKVSKEKLNKSRQLPMSKKGNDKRRFVIVGGGVAGLSAAETLRQNGFEGDITILTKENEAPYDRTLLSKFFATKLPTIKSESFLQEYDINLVKGANVTQLDTQKNYIQTADGQHLHYEKLLIATGANPRVPPIPNVNAKGVLTLRNWEDLQEIKKYATGSKNIVIAGASFIGLESASSVKAFLKDQKVNITVCDVAKTPYERVLGAEVGTGVQKLHEDNGINFKLQNSIKNINVNSEGKVQSVNLADGSQLDADLVIVGTGVAPNTKFLSNSLPLSKDGGIQTDIFQKVQNQQDVFAAGDVATYPWWYTGQNIRIEHYNEAIHQGHVAALNMLGQTVPNDNVPFFWTRFHNKSLGYTGHAQKYDETYTSGNVKEQKFITYYFWNNQVVAAAAMGELTAISLINEAMKQNLLPKAADLKSGRVTLADIQKKVQAKGHNCKCRGRGCGGKKKQQQATN